MRSIFLSVCQLQQSHSSWDQVPLQRDPLVCEDHLDQGRLAFLPTAEKETTEKPPKERKPESMIRLLPQFPSQLKMCLMLEKINSVYNNKNQTSTIKCGWNLIPSWPTRLLKRTKPKKDKKNTSPTHHQPLLSEKKESKV